MKKLLLLLTLSFTVSVGFTQQLKSFSDTKEAYLKELISLFSDNKEFQKDFMEEKFEPLWASGAVSAVEAKLYIDLSNKMLKKYYKPEPHFRQLVETIFALKETNATAQAKVWQDALIDLVGGRSKSNFENYLSAVHGLFTDGTIYESNSVKWTISGGAVKLKDQLVVATNVDLIGYSREDSSIVDNTSGTYDPATERWLGKGGRITWERVGLDPATNYATLNSYEIKIKSSFFDVDTVQLTTQFFPKPVIGKLREKMISVKDPTDAKYPAFDSFDRSLLIKDIHPGIDYQGGFSLKGAEFRGLGEPRNPSILYFKQNNKVFAVARSINFTINERYISTDIANITVYFKNDSLVHDGVILKFSKEKNELEFIRGEDGITSGPFSSSYHKLDIYTQRISWTAGSDTLRFGNLRGNAQNISFFESSNFFYPTRFTSLSANGEANPLVLLKTFSSQKRSQEFTLVEFANFARMSKEDAVVYVINIANKGFISYNIDTEDIKIKSKMFDFILAFGKKVDYDPILIKSTVNSSQETNAYLDLNSLDLNVLGVSRVSLSDSQSVEIFANKKTEYVTIQENRNMLFNGVLKAGNFDFYGDSFAFNYDEYKVTLARVDSARLYVIRVDDKQRKQYVPVSTEIHKIVGEIYIDNPLNKSGMNSDNGEYPILVTKEPSFTYYDKEETLGGVYNRNDFFFEINPFTLDSLDSFKEEQLRFTGTLKSAGIFPDIVDSIKVMPDFSLGFVHKTPEGGLPMYGDIAKFNNDIDLSDEGLKGDGDLVYVTSTTKSRNFFFFPDSTNAVAQAVTNVKKTGAPDVPDFTGEDFDFQLLAKENKMIAAMLKKPFDMFNKEAQAKGELYLTPQQLTSTGKLEMFDGIISAELFKYNNTNAFSDTANFELKDVTGEGLAISSENVNVRIDFAYHEGVFAANDPTDSKINFPKNQYQAFMDKYKWLIDEREFAFTSTTKPSDEDPLASHFLSLKPGQDSLRFEVPEAIYNVDNYLIKAKKVEKILVADAYILPAGGNVDIEPDAVITPLEDATIIADYINKFHEIFNAKVDIKGRKLYQGSGNYNYIDEFGNKQKIAFADISIDSSRHTFAFGNIPQEQGFKLNQYFDYKGDVMLRALEKGLNFSGATQIVAACENIDRNWLFFKGQIDPANAIIPVGENMVNDSAQALAAGLIIEAEGEKLYPAFISAKINEKDIPVATASGFLWYDAKDKSYKIGSKAWFEGREEGNLVVLNTQTCDLTTKGEFGFGLELGQVEAKGYGSSKYSAKTGAVSLEGMVSLNFFFEKKILETIASRVVDYPFLQPINLTATPYLSAVKAYCDPKKAKNIEEELTSSGVIDKVPDCLNKSVLFANVKLNWDTAQSAFISSGQLQMASLLDKQVFVTTRGHLMFQRSRRGNEVGLYFEWDPNMWYFYRYKFDANPRMQVYASDKEIVDMINEVKEGDRQQKTKNKEASFVYEVAPRTSKDAFLDKVR